MSTWATIAVVAGREVRQRLRGKSFYLSTALIVVLLVGVGLAVRITSGDDGSRRVTVAIVGDVPAGFDDALHAVGEQLDLEVATEVDGEIKTARAALRDGQVDAVLDTGSNTVLQANDRDSTLHAALQQAWAVSSLRSNLGGAGLDADEIDRALATQPLTSRTIDEGIGSDDGIGELVGVLAGILLFMALQIYGSFIMMGVIEEKASAVIEVLLARVHATRLLAGKVLGIGMVAVAQFAITTIAGVVALAIAGTNVPGEVWGALPWAVVWFIGGFSLYAFLFALAGSLVSRQEDSQSALLPVSALLIGAYIAVFLVMDEPGSTAARILSVAPPSAPLIMPLRIATGSARGYEIGLALVVLMATIVGIARLSGRIYTRLVLRRGARITWLDALRTGN